MKNNTSTGSVNKTTDERKKALIRRFHAVCHANNMVTSDKEALLDGYGVDSSSNLTVGQLVEIINKLGNNPDQWRKRVLAAIGAWLRNINKPETIDTIKGIACRASGYDKFNAIPVSRLRDIYYEFSRKAKTVNEVKEVKASIINPLKWMN